MEIKGDANPLSRIVIKYAYRLNSFRGNYRNIPLPTKQSHLKRFLDIRE